MIDALRRQARFVVTKGCQWHLDSVRRPHINVLECIRVLLIGQLGLHHNVVLIQRLVHGRDLPLAESGVQRIVDNLRSDPKPRCGVTVDDHPRCQSPVLKVGIRIAYLRECFDPVEHDVRPCLRSSMVSLWTVYWNCALPLRPPMRNSWGDWRKSVEPGSCSLGRRRAMT